MVHCPQSLNIPSIPYVPDANEILQWIEDFHTLHWSLELLYVVDGYILHLLQDGSVMATYGGKTSRDCYTKAMKFKKPGN